jgi:membrane-bound metal-dependent hydrolase YbcI (DUF457 family)
MPYAVTHVILTIVVLDLIRDYVIKDGKRIPLHLLFLGGIAGLLPDIDIPLYWLLNKVLGIQINWFHRTFSHSIFFALLFLLATILLLFTNKEKYWLPMAVISFGVCFHIFLDVIFAGYVTLFYPFTTTKFGFDLAAKIAWPGLMEGLDALILLVWLYDLDRRHRLRDFI